MHCDLNQGSKTSNSAGGKHHAIPDTHLPDTARQAGLSKSDVIACRNTPLDQRHYGARRSSYQEARAARGPYKRDEPFKRKEWRDRKS